MDRYLTVTALNRYLKAKFEQDRHLTKVLLKGELSNVKKHMTGTYYFTIKDNNSRIGAIMFAKDVQELDFELSDGMQIHALGSVSIYENSGIYSFIAKKIEVAGLGNLYLKMEQTKKKLMQEGLFDPIYKKELPAYPKDIGVITGDNSAALNDIINTINNRFPSVRLHIYKTLVQGKDAYVDIIDSLLLADSKQHDVLILARGGGSFEDLMNFNEEDLVRCVFSLKTPIITGVGHEIDYTLADYVSDFRAPTPTGAAVACVKNYQDVLINIDSNISWMATILEKRISDYKEKINRVYQFDNIIKNNISKHSLLIANHKQKIESLFKQKIINEQNRIQQNVSLIHSLMAFHLKQKQDLFAFELEKLELASPLNILKKGYSIISKDEVIKNSKDIKEGDHIHIMMNDGVVSGYMKGVTYGRNEFRSDDE